MKLSVVLATRNEEENIGLCLESVRRLADEIIIIDEHSTDKTREIAENFGAKVYLEPHHDIFHITKQKALEKAKGDWILQLDADERVTPELTEEIKEAIKNTNFNGYWVSRKNWFMGKFLKKGGQYPDHTLRLYRKGRGRLPAKDVHEQAEVEGKVGYLKSDLLHFRDVSFSKYMSGLTRYTNLMALQLGEQQLSRNLLAFFEYFLVRPIWWFLKVYFRHKGFVDGWQGFVFASFSSLRFPIAYFKYLQMKQ